MIKVNPSAAPNSSNNESSPTFPAPIDELVYTLFDFESQVKQARETFDGLMYGAATQGGFDPAHPWIRAQLEERLGPEAFARAQTGHVHFLAKMRRRLGLDLLTAKRQEMVIESARARLKLLLDPLTPHFIAQKISDARGTMSREEQFESIQRCVAAHFVEVLLPDVKKDLRVDLSDVLQAVWAEGVPSLEDCANELVDTWERSAPVPPQMVEPSEVSETQTYKRPETTMKSSQGARAKGAGSSLSKRDRDVLKIVGNRRFSDLTNEEIMRDREIKDELRKTNLRPGEDATKNCLDRIRKSKGFPLSLQIRSDRSSG